MEIDENRLEGMLEEDLAGLCQGEYKKF